jgi:menaquinone reductase, molybdopterin-binding-like subunit
MDWDRRTFVKFAVGAVIGVHASPLVPKLMDDSTIWTQNWSWVPVPEDGAVAYAKTVNPQTGTGVLAKIVNGRVDGERAIRVEGDTEHPLSQGGVVPADASALQLLYNDEVRVTSPMLKNRQTGEVMKITWSEALDQLAGNLSELSKTGKAHQVLALAPDPSDCTGRILSRLMQSMGSPNTAFTPTPRETMALAGVFMMGQPFLGFDLANADFVVSFGTPLLEGFGAPAAVRRAFANWRGYPKNPGHLVQIEPRASVTASQADQWLPCKAGSEGAIALGMCRIMIEEGIYDKSIESAHGFNDVKGFAGFKSMLMKDYSRNKVAKLAGIPLAKLIKITLAFAKAKRGVAVCGPGNSGDPGRMYDFMAVLALNALKGNLGKTGGVLAQQPLPLKPLGPAIADPQQPPLAGSERPFNVNNVHAMAEAALAKKPYGIKTLILCGGNFVFNGPQANVMQDLARKTPFVVAITPYLDESAAVADLILPSTHWLEGWGDSTTPYGSPVAAYGLHRPLVKAVPLARDTGDILLAVAQRLGGKVVEALPFKTTAEALAKRSEDMGDFEELAEAGYWVQKKPAYGKIQFNTTSGKLELFSTILHDLSVKRAGSADVLERMLVYLGVQGGAQRAFLPHWQPPAAWSEMKGDSLIMQAVPSLRTTWGGDAITPYMVKILSDTMLADKDKLVVEMNPQTAKALHLYDGDMVMVESGEGSLRAKLSLFKGAAPGMVFAPVGLGHEAFGFQVAGKGMNFNNAARVVSDPMSGMPIWELTGVTVKKARG